MNAHDLETQARLDAAKAAVDAASRRHAQSVAGVVRHAAGTANTVAKTAAFGVLLGARYVAGFAQGLVRPGNA
jgi:hypothetical protein